MGEDDFGEKGVGGEVGEGRGRGSRFVGGNGSGGVLDRVDVDCVIGWLGEVICILG